MSSRCDAENSHRDSEHSQAAVIRWDAAEKKLETRLRPSESTSLGTRAVTPVFFCVCVPNLGAAVLASQLICTQAKLTPQRARLYVLFDASASTRTPLFRISINLQAVKAIPQRARLYVLFDASSSLGTRAVSQSWNSCFSISSILQAVKANSAAS